MLLGNAVRAPAEVATELVRLEPVQVMLAAEHPCAGSDAVPVAALAGEEWLLPAEDVAPEWNDLVVDLCQRAGFRPRRYPGTTWGPTAAAELAVERRCVVPTNAWVSAPAGVVFRPLVEPAVHHPWSAMWWGEPTGRWRRSWTRPARSRPNAAGRATATRLIPSLSRPPPRAGRSP